MFSLEDAVRSDLLQPRLEPQRDARNAQRRNVVTLTGFRTEKKESQPFVNGAIRCGYTC